MPSDFLRGAVVLHSFVSEPALAVVNIHAVDAGHSRPANKRVFCTGYGPPLEVDDAAELHPSVVRWGGNTASRFNFKAGNLWNAGSDWHYSNVSRGKGDLWLQWILKHRDAGREVIFTVPIFGWLAKDSVTRGNPRVPDASRTSIPLTDDDFRFLIAKIRETLLSQERIYPLDNEPFQWHAIHGDAVAKKIEPKEFAARWLHYAKLVREVDVDGVLSGPGLWGWADLPNLDPFLEDVLGKTDAKGKPFLNIVSGGIYPQNTKLLQDLSDITGRKVSQQNDQKGIAELRVSTVANWDDENYVDPSWIAKPVAYVTTLEKRILYWSEKKKIAQKDRPLVGIAEYNWGGAATEAGAASQALLLMKGLKLPIHHMCTFTWPPPASPSGKVFRALHDFVLEEKGGVAKYAVPEGQDSRMNWLWLSSRNNERVLFFVADKNARVLLPNGQSAGTQSQQGDVASARSENTAVGDIAVEKFDVKNGLWRKVDLEGPNSFRAKQYGVYKVAGWGK